MNSKAILLPQELEFSELTDMCDLRLVCERHKDTPFPDWTSKDVIEVLEGRNDDIAASSKNEYQKTLRVLQVAKGG